MLDDRTIRDGIDFILSHFEHQHELFPRTIMTHKTGGQIKIEYESNVQNSKDKIFEYFEESEFIDCKINAFPFNTEHTGGVDLQVKNKTAATFIMIDLDLKDFGHSKEKLDKQLKKTMDKLSLKFKGDAYPTVLWTGNGYHIYQPIDGMVFEEHKIFYDFLPYVDNRNLTTEFSRFAEKFFTSGKADPNHMPSVKSCLVRVPGTINSKNGGDQQVRVIQKWNGKRPAIQWITADFRDHLIQTRIDKIREKGTRKSSFNKHTYTIIKIEWIETLLQTPLEDYRKYCLWRIILPYLVNIRKLKAEESTEIAGQWLQKCDQLKRIDFNPSIIIKNDLKNVKKYLPPSKEKLKNEQQELYGILKLQITD